MWVSWAISVIRARSTRRSPSAGAEGVGAAGDRRGGSIAPTSERRCDPPRNTDAAPDSPRLGARRQLRLARGVLGDLRGGAHSYSMPTRDLDHRGTPCCENDPEASSEATLVGPWSAGRDQSNERHGFGREPETAPKRTRSRRGGMRQPGRPPPPPPRERCAQRAHR